MYILKLELKPLLNNQNCDISTNKLFCSWCIFPLKNIFNAWVLSISYKQKHILSSIRKLLLTWVVHAGHNQQNSNTEKPHLDWLGSVYIRFMKTLFCKRIWGHTVDTLYSFVVIYRPSRSPCTVWCCVVTGSPFLNGSLWEPSRAEVLVAWDN